MVNITLELAKSAKSVQEALDNLQISCQVVQLSDSTRSAVEAADSIGCDIGQIVKSLIFKIKSSNQPVLILASGPNRVNEKAVESIITEAIGKADADFVRDITGFAIGGIPPLGHKQKIEHIIIDEDLLKHEQIWAAAGTPNAVFNISSKDLVRVTKGKIAKIV